MNRVIATRTTHEPIYDDSTPFEITAAVDNIQYVRYEDNDTDSIYIQKWDSSDGVKKYHTMSTWANKATATYKAINY